MICDVFRIGCHTGSETPRLKIIPFGPAILTAVSKFSLNANISYGRKGISAILK